MRGSSAADAFALALAALWLAACAAPPPPVLPLPPEPSDYRLQPGDVVRIKVFDRPELEQTIPIRPDGRISAAPFQDVRAAGLTIPELDALLTRGLDRMFDDPQVSVIVREFHSNNVFVGGEIAKPGIVPLRDGMTSLMAIIEAGGFRASAQMTNVVVLRETPSGPPQVVKMDLERILDEGLPDVVLQPFDVVFVPKSKIARVNLWVQQYIVRMIPGSVVSSSNYSYLYGDVDNAADAARPLP